MRRHLGGLVFVSVGTFFKLGSGLLVLIYIARVLGSEEFGKFSLWLAVATMAVIPVNFGFATAVLREFGQVDVDKRKVLSSVIAAKIQISFAVWTLVIVSSMFIPEGYRIGALVLVAAQTFESFAETYALSFRAVGAYKREALSASVVAAFQMLAILFAGLFLDEALGFAIVFAASRLLGVFLFRCYSKQAFGVIGCASFSEGRALIKSSFPYGVEFFLNTVYTQIDSLVIGMVLGVRAVGLYQAGMKIVLGFSRIGPIVAMYLLPYLSQSYVTKRNVRIHATGVVASFALFGAVLWVSIFMFSEFIEVRVFGESYEGLGELLSLFGALLFVRFVETGFGMVLVAKGLQGRKVLMVAVQIVILFATGVPLMLYQGLSGWIFSAIFSTVALLLMYIRLLSPARAEAVS